MPTKYDPETIEKESLDFDEFATNTDIKINPDFYIHTGILKAQQALASENAKEAFLKYRVFVEHIEVLCRAANRVSEDYEQKIEDFKNTKEYKDLETDFLKITSVASKKLQYLMENVFSMKTTTDPMILR